MITRSSKKTANTSVNCSQKSLSNSGQSNSTMPPKNNPDPELNKDVLIEQLQAEVFRLRDLNKTQNEQLSTLRGRFLIRWEGQVLR